MEPYLRDSGYLLLQSSQYLVFTPTCTCGVGKTTSGLGLLLFSHFGFPSFLPTARIPPTCHRGTKIQTSSNTLHPFTYDASYLMAMATFLSDKIFS